MSGQLRTLPIANNLRIPKAAYSKSVSRYRWLRLTLSLKGNTSIAKKSVNLGQPEKLSEWDMRYDQSSLHRVKYGVSYGVTAMPKKPKGFAKPAPVQRKFQEQKQEQEQEAIAPESKPTLAVLNLLVTIGMIAYGLFQLAMIILESKFEKKGDRQ
jgi:hypothetical protein